MIGKGSTLGTTPALSIDENLLVTISDDILVTDRAYGGALEAENDGSFNLAEGNDFSCTTTGNTEITFTNAKAGQSGNIKFVNGGSHTITANALVAINADALSTLATVARLMSGSIIVQKENLCTWMYIIHTKWRNDENISDRWMWIYWK